MNIENTKAQMRKGVLEYCILSVIKEREAYTSEILDTLKGYSNSFIGQFDHLVLGERIE